MTDRYKYRAFISYSHRDEKWASWLHKALETYRVPKYLVGTETHNGQIGHRLGKVFRDRDELSSSHSLGVELTQALEDSACQIVICSPNAANSHWTNEEILAYKRLGREQRIFCLIVDGEPWASNSVETVDQECFPHALRFQMGEDGKLGEKPSEPIAADARAQGDGRQNAKLKLISGMLGIGFDALKQRDLQRRQRRMFAITGAAVLGMLVTTSLAALAILARDEAERQRIQAELDAETARQTTSFMVGLFNVSEPNEALGNSITAREIMDKGAVRIEEELGSQPAIQSVLMETMGTVYTSLALYTQAAALLRSSLEKRRELYGDQHLEVARSLDRLGEVLKLNAEYADARKMYAESLAIRRDLLGNEHLDVASSLYEMADLLGRMGEFANAEPMFREALAIQLKLLGAKNEPVAKSMEGLALNLYDQGNYEDPIPILREVVAMRRELHDGPHTDLTEAMNNLAFVLGDSGAYSEAEQLYRESLEMMRFLLGDAHPEIALGLNNVAFSLHDQGKYKEAEVMYREAIAMQREIFGEDHPEVALALNNLAFVLYDMGDIATAVEMTRESLAMKRRTLGDQHPQVAQGMNNLAMWLMDLGEYESAEQLLRESLVMNTQLVGENHTSTAASMTLLASCLVATGHFSEARQLASGARDVYTESLSADHWRTAVAVSAEGAAIAGQKDYAEAEYLLVRSFEILSNDPGALQTFVDETANRLAKLYEEWGKPDLAARYQESPDDLPQRNQ